MIVISRSRNASHHVPGPELRHRAAATWTPDLWKLQRCAADAIGGRGMAAMSWCHGSADWKLARTCFHEAGHAAVARALGLQPATIEIDDSEHGRCLVTRGSNVDHLRVAALAGHCSQLIAEKGSAAVIAAEVFRDLALDPRALSEGDAKFSHRFTAADVGAALQILTGRWRIVSALARWAIEDFLREQGATPAKPLDARSHAAGLIAYRQRGLQC